MFVTDVIEVDVELKDGNRGLRVFDDLLVDRAS
jgi:hypothetical protein